MIKFLVRIFVFGFGFFVFIAKQLPAASAKADSVILFLTQKLQTTVNSHQINSMIIFDVEMR